MNCFFRFLGSNLRILPVHNTVNAINLMCTIAKVSHLRKMTHTYIHLKVLDFKMHTLWSSTDKYSASVPFREVAIFSMPFFPKPGLSLQVFSISGSHY